MKTWLRIAVVAAFLVEGVAFAQQIQATDNVPTPEPGTVMLMATGVAGLAYGVWRRNRAK